MPTREEYPSDEAFEEAWRRWRKTRESNNRSVRRAREKAKERAESNAVLKERFASRTGQLEHDLAQAKRLAALAYYERDALSPPDRQLLLAWGQR